MTKWMWAAAVATMLGTTAAQAAPVTYQLGGGGSLQVLVKYDRNAIIAGHDHVLASSTYSGSVTWDTADPSVCNVKISMPVSSLQVDPPGTRAPARAGGRDPRWRQAEDPQERPGQVPASCGRVPSDQLSEHALRGVRRQGQRARQLHHGRRHEAHHGRDEGCRRTTRALPPEAPSPSRAPPTAWIRSPHSWAACETRTTWRFAWMCVERRTEPTAAARYAAAWLCLDAH